MITKPRQPRQPMAVLINIRDPSVDALGQGLATASLNLDHVSVGESWRSQSDVVVAAAIRRSVAARIIRQCTGGLVVGPATVPPSVRT